MNKISKKILVSVVVPIFNAERYLKDCLDSLICQTLDGLQIVCVDDGSTDSSPEILREYSRKNRNIKIVHQKNQGLGGARNTGIRNSDGEYIGFVDADDYVDSRMFETLYNLAKKNKCEIAMCNLDFVPKETDTKKHLWFKPYNGVISGEFLDRNIQPWNKIVSRKLVSRLNFEFFKRNGDDMYIILMLQSRGIISTNEILYHYRVGHDTMSNTFKIDSFINFIECTKEQIRIAKKNGDYASLKEYFDYRMIYVLLQTMSVAALKQNHRVFKMCRAELKKHNFRKNKYVKSLLRKDYSRLEYIGMLYVLPVSYRASCALMGYKLKGWK